MPGTRPRPESGISALQSGTLRQLWVLEQLSSSLFCREKLRYRRDLRQASLSSPDACSSFSAWASVQKGGHFFVGRRRLTSQGFTPH